VQCWAFEPIDRPSAAEIVAQLGDVRSDVTRDGGYDDALTDADTSYAPPSARHGSDDTELAYESIDTSVDE
jgi:hypothetical protein